MRNHWITIAAWVAMHLSGMAMAKTVRYELTITKQPINLSGHKTVDWALMVNNSIPAPTLEFTEGDDAEILVKNGLSNEEVSLHWHGILLPPEEDGVAYINTPPIFPGKSRLFKFKIRQHGTYWYHSHTMLQEQKGVYGAFIIYPQASKIKADKDVVAVLSDWSDENPDQIMRNLRKDGDYYLYKKHSLRSFGGAIKSGGMMTYLANQWERMEGMDLSDVGYDAFFINGKRDSQLLTANPGDSVRLRIINAAASSYFYVSLSGLPMRVISADGVDIEPIETRELLMGMAETYDVLLTIPQQGNYELRATCQDVTGYASAWIGKGDKVTAPDKPQPDLYAPMHHASHNQHAGHQGMQTQHQHHHDPMHTTPPPSQPAAALEILTVDDIQALTSTALPSTAKVTELKLVLGGDMERYVWHINGKAIHQDRDIHVNEGEVVRFIFENQTMMHHPMHLHGHFFRVINQYGDRSPMKHTVDVPPHGTRTIEFFTNEPGIWMLHCHNLYHMKTGMARFVNYLSFKPSTEMAQHAKHDPHLHQHLYTYGLLEAATHHARAHFKLMRTWDELELAVESRSDTDSHFVIAGTWDVEGDLIYRRWFGNYFNFIVGGTNYDEAFYGMAGFGVILPMLIETQALVNHEGRFRLDVEKRLQWASHLFTDVEFTWRLLWEGEHEEEVEITLMYGPSWHWAAGLMLTETSLGIGAQVQF